MPMHVQLCLRASLACPATNRRQRIMCKDLMFCLSLMLTHPQTRSRHVFSCFDQPSTFCTIIVATRYTIIKRGSKSWCGLFGGLNSAIRPSQSQSLILATFTNEGVPSRGSQKRRCVGLEWACLLR